MWEYNNRSGEPPDSKQQGQATNNETRNKTPRKSLEVNLISRKQNISEIQTLRLICLFGVHNKAFH